MTALFEFEKYLTYDPETGQIVRKTIGTPGNQRYVGNEAGWIETKGYRAIMVAGKIYKAHRIAWLFLTGEWPALQIDHINGNKSDNRAVNLRLATSGENQRNRGKLRTNTSGFKGVHWIKRRRKYAASIRFDGCRKHLGYFDSPEDASRAYSTAAKQYHGNFAKVWDL